MSPVVIRIALAGSGAILGLVGSALMFTPTVFLAMGEAFITPEPSLMSEVTAPSGLLVMIGALMILGSLKLRFANLALLSGALVYGSYGISRLISMGLYGEPSESLIFVTYFELGIAVILLAIRHKALSAEQRNQADTDMPEITI